MRLMNEISILNETQFVDDILKGRDVLKRLGKVTFDLNKKYIQINKHGIHIVRVEN